MSKSSIYNYLWADRSNGGELYKNLRRRLQGAMEQCLRPHQALVHTITADNGKEFAAHRQVSAVLDTEFYFAPARIIPGNAA